jgi:hypothetical protein
MELARHYEGRRRRRWLTVTVAMVAAGVTAFAVYDGVTSSPKASAEAKTDRPATVEAIGKTGLKRVVLTPNAAKRLDIHTARAGQELVNGELRAVIPYAAVLYDSNGKTWTYTSPKRLVFVRRDIDVDAIEGDRAVLADGPRPGTTVVTVGSAELWGIEYGEIEED